MADTLISSSGYVQIESNDGTTTDTIQFGGSTIERLSDSKTVLFDGDAEPPLGYTPENVANRSNTINNSTTEYPDSAAVLAALNLKLDATKQSISTTVAGLRAMTSGAPQTDVLYQTTDYGTGNWYWDTASTETDNLATVLKATAIATGRFKRIYPRDQYQATWFGVTADGTTDDYDALQLAINTVNTLGGGNLILPRGTIYLNKSFAGGIKLPANSPGLTIRGAGIDETVFKLTMNVQRLFDLTGISSSSTTVTYKNFVIGGFTVDSALVLAANNGSTVTYNGGTTLNGNGTFITVSVTSNTSYPTQGLLLLPVTNAGTAKDIYCAFTKPAGTTSLSVRIPSGLTLINGDSLTGAIYSHVIIGSVGNGYNDVAPNNNIIDNITVEDVKSINVASSQPYTNNTRVPDARPQVSFNSWNNSGYSGTLSITNINVRRVSLYGGTMGIFTGSSLFPQLSKVFLDNVNYIDCFHDTQLSPTLQCASYNFQIGNTAFGNRGTIINCRGYNSADVGVETDALMQVIVQDVAIYDSWGGAFTSINYNAPALTSAGAPTSLLTAAITTSNTSIAINAIPVGVATSGFIVIDTELMYYTYSSPTTLNVIRALNAGSSAAAHNSGSTVTYIEIEKQFVSYTNCYAVQTANIGDVPHHGWYLTRNTSTYFPPPNAKLINCGHTKSNSYLTNTNGIAIAAYGLYSLDIDGFTAVETGINHTGGTARSSTHIDFKNVDWDITNTVKTEMPLGKFSIRNADLRTDGILYTGDTYSGIHIDETSTDVLIQNVHITHNLTAGDGQVCGIVCTHPGSNINGNVDNFKYSTSSKLINSIGLNLKSCNFIKLYLDNLDFTDNYYDTTIPPVDNNNYKPVLLDLSLTSTYQNIILGQVKHSTIIPQAAARKVARVAPVTAATYTQTLQEDVINVNYNGAVNISLALIEAGATDYKTNYGCQVLIGDSGGFAATHNITLTAAGSETINGASTYVINAAYGSVMLTALPGGKWLAK